MFDRICKNCGRRLSDYLRTGYLGCPDCYRAFSNEIEDSLFEIQGSNENKGKKPNVNSIDRELLSEYERLIKEREEAGLNGNFSDMARLSNEINVLYRELEERGLI